MVDFTLYCETCETQTYLGYIGASSWGKCSSETVEEYFNSVKEDKRLLYANINTYIALSNHEGHIFRMLSEDWIDFVLGPNELKHFRSFVEEESAIIV
jgi:hypothetical protein